MSAAPGPGPGRRGPRGDGEAGGGHGHETPQDFPAEDAEEIIVGFRRTAGGVSARFTAAQAGIVRTLVGQVADLLEGDADSRGGAGQWPADVPDPGAWPGGPAAPPGSPGGGATGPGPDDLDALLFGGPALPPEDPVLARLLPDAYRDDPEAAGEFRQYTERGLRSGKVEAARTVLASLPAKGGRVRLSAEDGQVWLRAINDVRLALGVRLGISEDYEEELAGLDATDPRLAYFQVYDWLTFLQETLVRALW